MTQTVAYAALSATSPLAPMQISRRDLREKDVLVDILFCGVCHSDLHMARNEWKGSTYPIVPGHEIIGRVSKIGKEVSSCKEGDLVGVGCIVGSCRSCESCKSNLEQYCDQGFTLTFNAKDPLTGSVNYGGFSKQIVVEETYLLHIPDAFGEKNLAAAAPLLCAGITTYSPLKNWGVGKGTHLGIVGLGGLGHIAVKLGKAMGSHVTVFTTSPEKAAEGKKQGADEVIFSKEPSAFKKNAGRFDFILNTVAFVHNLNDYLALLKRDGAMCLVGLPSEPYQTLRADLLINKRRRLAGSLIGSIKETQEVLEFCAERNVLPDIELIAPSQINEAFERMLKGTVRYRFVIDMSTW